jgi:hypothetical protein
MAELWDAIMGSPNPSPQQTFAGNQQYAATPGRTDYNTALPQLDEFAFRQWVANNRVPFNPDSKGAQDYDMRGFWRGLMQENPHATSGTNPNDQQMHYSDYWKTPYHRSFSNESQYAAPNAPQWINDAQLASPGGRILFDERK